MLLVLGWWWQRGLFVRFRRIGVRFAHLFVRLVGADVDQGGDVFDVSKLRGLAAAVECGDRQLNPAADDFCDERLFVQVAKVLFAQLVEGISTSPKLRYSSSTVAASGAGTSRSGVWLALLMGGRARFGWATGRVVPGVQAVALGQFAQMLRHFKERSVALLACRHGHDLSRVFLGHVTVISRNCWKGQAQLLGQPSDAGLTYPG